MNYYKRHIGDYAKKAGHLSVYEHGVYTLILDAYYDRELAPTRAEAMRQARARSLEEIASVDAVLADFFKEIDGRFVQSRVEEEFVKAEEVAERNAAKGKLGGRPRKPKGKPEESRQLSNGKPDESPEKPNPLIHQSIKEQKTPPNPLTGEPAAAAIIAEYHAALPRCQRIEVLNPKRRKRIAVIDKLAASLCQQQGWTYDRTTFWRAYFAECASDPWLRGEQPNPKNPAWKQNLDVLIREDRFAGIMDSAISAMKVAA